MTQSHHPQQSMHNNPLQHVATPSASYPAQPQASSGSGYQASSTSAYATAQRGGYGSMTHHNQQFGTYNRNVTPYRNPDQTPTSAQGSVNTQPAYSQQNVDSASNHSTPIAHNSSGWDNVHHGASGHSISNNHVPNRSQKIATTSSYTNQASTASILAESNYRGSTSYQSEAFRQVPSTRPPTTNETTSASSAQFPHPQRYSSPSHALQAQQQQKHYSYQSLPSSTHNFPPQIMANQQRLNTRPNSVSVEPPPTTVNPSQVYDARAEQLRKEQNEAERRRKHDEQISKRKAEEDRLAKERHAKEEKRKIEEARAEAEKRRSREEAIARGKQADRNEVDAMRAEMTSVDKGPRTYQRHSVVRENNQSETAAAALQQMASGSAESNTGPNPSMQAESDEAQMRAMFARMREFNAKNPSMLAKLWEEERRHAQSHSPQPIPAPAANSGLTRASPAAAPLASQPRSLAPEPGMARSTPAPPPMGQSVQKPAFVVQTMPARAPDLQQSSQIRPQVSAHLWPKQKRPAISEVAVNWLMSLPENKGRILRAADVLKVLDGNPSYPQLCAGLQSLGAKFDQSSLARVILRGVPELVSTKTTGPEQSRSVVDSSRPRWSIEPASDNHLRRHGTPVNYETPTLASVNGPLDTNVGRSSAPGDTVLPSARPHPLMRASVPLPHAPSSDRSTAHSGPSAVESKPTPSVPIRPPANKEEAARKRKITDLVDLTTSDSDDDGPPLKRAILTPGVGSGVSTQHPSGSQGFSTFKLSSGGSLQAPGSTRPGTLVTSQFNAAGLKPARSQTIHAPPQSTSTQGRTPEKLQQERMKGKMLVEPIMRDRVARKSQYNSRTIARDVLLATGRHPDMKPLNQHLVVMSKLLSDHGAQQEMDGSRGLRSDLATIRWDIIDPGRPATLAATPAHADVKAHNDPYDQKDANDTVDEMDTVTAHDPITQPSSTMAYADVAKRKVGRPRKQDKQESVFVNNNNIPGSQRDTAVAGQAASTTPTAPTTIPTTEVDISRHSASPGAMSASGGAVGYAAFRKYDEHGNIIKTKGRPKGWKKSLHSREALGLETGAKKKPAVEKHMAIPHHQVFKCEWQGCPAELHNLETLKKHVVKLHDEENDAGQYACRWKDCSVNKLLPDFQSWTEHIYEAHMNPVAWNMGDGPGGGLPGHDRADSESYLSDAHGRSVTPVIVPHDSPTDSTSSIADAASLKVLIDHKSIVGPLFEKTGCTLANAKRRRGFLDDEDFEHHYEEDDARF